MLLEAFPFVEGHADKGRCQELVRQFQNPNTTVESRVELGKGLCDILSTHVGNLSLGNASQNSAIRSRLDLHAVTNGDGTRSFSPRSRRILEVAAQSPTFRESLSPPKITRTPQGGETILSSQYGLGKREHKEAANIPVRSLSPNSASLFKASFLMQPPGTQVRGTAPKRMRTQPA